MTSSKARNRRRVTSVQKHDEDLRDLQNKLLRWEETLKYWSNKDSLTEFAKERILDIKIRQYLAEQDGGEHLDHFSKMFYEPLRNQIRQENFRKIQKITDLTASQLSKLADQAWTEAAVAARISGYSSTGSINGRLLKVFPDGRVEDLGPSKTDL